MAGIRAATGNSEVFFLPLDLADLDSVRACAADFLARGEPLHVLVNNAGVAGHRGLTRQGFELTFGVNHLGHFVLTNALLGCLAASAPARVVTVSSDAHYSARGIDWDALRRSEPRPHRACASTRSRSCATCCSRAELARRTAGTGVTTYALHPGVVASDIWRRVPWPVRPLIERRMLTVEQGAETSLYCATSPEVAADSGLFYDKCAEREPSPVATPELAAELWKRSEEWAALRPSGARVIGGAAFHARVGRGWRSRWRCGASWRSMRLGARRPIRLTPVLRRVMAGREVRPVRRVAR